MRKILFFILLFLSSYPKGFSQNIEQNVFKLIFNDIQKQNEFCLFKEKMKESSIVVDPITGEMEIIYSSNIDDNIKAEFAKFNKEEQVKILSCNNYLIYLKDTLIIIDSIGFFPEEIVTFNQGKTVVNIVREYPKKNCTNCMSLFAVGFRHNSLIITLNNKNQNNQLYNYFFDLSCSSEIKLQKSSILNNKISIE